MKIIIGITLNRNGKLTKDGYRTVIISIYASGTRERKEIVTGIRVKPDEFRDGEILSNCPYYKEYNEILRTMKGKILSIYEELLKENNYVSPRQIKSAYKTTLLKLLV